MAYLPHKECHPSIISSLNLFNAENVDVSVKYGYYEQFYPQKPMSENVHYQTYSSNNYFIDLTATFLDLHTIVKKSNNEKPNAAWGFSYQYFALFLDKSLST